MVELHRFVIRTNKHKQYVVRFYYRQEVMFTSVPVSAHKDALALIESLKSFGPEARVVDKT